jgi:hypothetical protein
MKVIFNQVKDMESGISITGLGKNGKMEHMKMI